MLLKLTLQQITNTISVNADETAEVELQKGLRQ